MIKEFLTIVIVWMAGVWLVTSLVFPLLPRAVPLEPVFLDKALLSANPALELAKFLGIGECADYANTYLALSCHGSTEDFLSYNYSIAGSNYGSLSLGTVYREPILVGDLVDRFGMPDEIDKRQGPTGSLLQLKWHLGDLNIFVYIIGGNNLDLLYPVTSVSYSLTSDYPLY